MSKANSRSTQPRSISAAMGNSPFLYNPFKDMTATDGAATVRYKALEPIKFGVVERLPKIKMIMSMYSMKPAPKHNVGSPIPHTSLICIIFPWFERSNHPNVLSKNWGFAALEIMSWQIFWDKWRCSCRLTRKVIIRVKHEHLVHVAR